MAKFKDPVLKQIVDDLAFQNPTAPVIPVEMASISNAVVDATGGGVTNTRGTLTLTGNVDIPAGSMSVQYRRLTIDALTTGSSKTIGFVGESVQEKTLLEILTKFSASYAAYLVDEIVDEGPYTLGRDAVPIVLTPKPTSYVLAPEPVTLTVSADAIDITTFQNVGQLAVFTTTQPKPTYNEDLDTFIIQRFAKANGANTPFPASDCLLEWLPTPPDSNSDGMCTLRVTVTNPLSAYKGTRTFTYLKVDITSFVQIAQNDNNFPPVINYTEGQTQAQMLNGVFQAADIWFRATEVQDLAVKPVRVGDYNAGSDHTHAFGSAAAKMYTTAFSGSPSMLKVLSTALYPFEADVRFTITTPAQKRLFVTTNTGTMPVTVTLVEKPAGYAPGALTYDANFLTTDVLPAGTYRIRITRPDSYRTPLRFRDFNSSNPAELNITEVLKVKGHDLTGMFAYNTNLTVVGLDAFLESTYTYKASSLFAQCSSLAFLPNNILHPMTRCYEWQTAFSQTLALRTVPNNLFGFLKAYRPNVSQIFYQAGPDNIPANFFQNARWMRLINLFSQYDQTVSVSPGLLAAMNLQDYTETFSGMFSNCTKLQTVDSNFFVGAKGPNFVANDPYFGNWNLGQMFQGCTAFTTIPSGFLAPLIATGAPMMSMQDVFRNCTSLTAIPADFLQGITVSLTGTPAFAGTWYGCTGLTTLPAGLFAGVDLKKSMMSEFTTVTGTFQNSGLTSIPATLFAGQTALKGMQYAFAGTKIVTIPAGLFANLPTVTDLRLVFQGCTLLTTVPATLFDGVPGLLFAEGVFRDCTALTSVPATLLTPLVNLQSAPYFFWNAPITAIPVGFFATNAALQTVEGFFYQTALVGVIDNVFTNQPVLVTAESAFSGTKITGTGQNVFQVAPELTNVRSLFSMCKQLTSVHPNLLSGQTKLLNASSMFSNTEVLTTVPESLFANCAVLNNVSFMFSLAIGLTSLPDQMFAGQIHTLTTIAYFAVSAANLTNVPAFSNQANCTRADNAFANCASLTVLPPLFMASVGTSCASFDSAFQGCTGLTALPETLFGIPETFPTSELPVSMASVFQGCTGLTAIPDGLFFPMKNITSLRFAFLNCYSLVSVGRLVANTKAVKLEIAGLLGGDLVGTGPATYPDFTVADNVIDSTIPLNIGAYGFVLPFNRRSLWTKNITNLFGANCKFQIATFETKNYFAGMQLTGSGIDFIAKHAVPVTSNGFFTGTTTLSDYATLPAWAKA